MVPTFGNNVRLTPPLPTTSKPDRLPMSTAATMITTATPSPVKSVVRLVLRLSGCRFASKALSDAAIGVESTEDIVAKVGEDDGGKSDDQDHGTAVSAPAAQGPRMQIDTVEEP